MEMQIDQVETPIGDVTVVACGDVLCALDFTDCRPRMIALLEARFQSPALTPTIDPGGLASRVRRYFEGDLHAFRGVGIDPGGTPFQVQVWMALREVPPGRTSTYGEIATAVGRPKAARAVGAANAQNPIALAIPCHRIVGADGSLTGYAGGVARKRWLLHHEGLGEEWAPSAASGPRWEPGSRGRKQYGDPGWAGTGLDSTGPGPMSAPPMARNLRPHALQWL